MFQVPDAGLKTRAVSETCRKKAEQKQEMQNATGQKLQTLIKEELVKIGPNSVSQP